jgi:hypothetical protein
MQEPTRAVNKGNGPERGSRKRHTLKTDYVGLEFVENGIPSLEGIPSKPYI